MLFSWTYSSENFSKIYKWNIYVLSSATVFNIDNNNSLLSSKSTLNFDTEDWSNDAGNLAAHHSNTLHFIIYIQIENSYFKLL